MESNEGSQVARLRNEIEIECEAMLHANSFAQVARHEIIQYRYDAVGRKRDELALLIGEQRATNEMIDIYTRSISKE